MKVYSLEAPRKIKISEKKIPRIREDEVLIKISTIGLCGSDMHLYYGSYSGPCSYPLLLGHEWSGIIEDVGSKVTDIKKGDKVTGDASKYCGHCNLCDTDKNLCINIEKFGVTTDGAFAEYIVRNSRYIYKAPKRMELDLICFAEPFAVSARLLKKIAGYKIDFKEKTVLIIGGGTLGIAALLILKNQYKCKNIYLFDILEERNRLAEKLGAAIPKKKMLDPGPFKLDYKSMYENKMFDIVIEATGNPNAFIKSLELVKPSGIIGNLGMMGDISINQKIIVLKCLTIIGSIGGTGEFPQMLKFINENRGSVRKMISHKIPISKLDEAFNLSDKIKNIMKVQLLFNND